MLTADQIIDLASLPEVVQSFRPRCPGCTVSSLTAPGARPCSHYDCPGLPSELQVTCNTCMYDFAADDGQMKCDHATCETAHRLKGNVETYRAWIDIVRQEAAS